MPTFAFSGRTRSGETVAGERVGDTMDTVVAMLRREQVLVTKVTPVKAKAEASPKKGKLGKGVTAKSNAALWRQRGDHKPLVGEYAFQAKFDRKDELHPKVQHSCEEFFVNLQNIAHDWVSVGTTKTGVVYRLKGNPPHSHE